MPPKTSAEMREALRLVMSGLSGRDAARQAGVREESLYRLPEYKKWRAMRLTIEESIGKYVPLKKTGHRYLGLCPFHEEKSPSFSVDAESRTFQCFGCGVAGDTEEFFRLMNEKTRQFEAKLKSAVFDRTQLISCYAPPNLRSVMPGNRVMLRSGGPEMIVSGVDDKGRAICQWLSHGKLEREAFDLECLTCYGAK